MFVKFVFGLGGRPGYRAHFTLADAPSKPRLGGMFLGSTYLYGLDDIQPRQ